jgi:MFS family permease
VENKTKTGLLLLIIGIILGVISNGIFFIDTNIAISVSILGSIGSLLIFIGIILMILGRKEYTERHRKFIVISLFLFILSVILSVIIVAVAFASVIISKDISPVGNAMYAIPVASIIGGLAYVFLLFELQDKNGKIVLISALILTVMISTFLAINIQSVFEETFGSIIISQDINTEEITELSNTFSQKVGELSAFSVIHNLVMLLAFIMAYKRIESGDIPSTSDKSFSYAESPKDEWYCPHCGRSVPSDANICPYCGKKM